MCNFTLIVQGIEQPAVSKSMSLKLEIQAVE